MRTVIAGGRDYQFTQDDIDFLDKCKKHITIVITGGAEGADTWGKVWAENNDIPHVEIPADWNKHGKAAGPIRNELMGLLCDIVILFPGGRGTANMQHVAFRLDRKIIYAKEMMSMGKDPNTGEKARS